MELKYIGGAITGLGAIVLIVPLWNWNKVKSKINVINNSFNRTFMELKCL